MSRGAFVVFVVRPRASSRGCGACGKRGAPFARSVFHQGPWPGSSSRGVGRRPTSSYPGSRRAHVSGHCGRPILRIGQRCCLRVGPGSAGWTLNRARDEPSLLPCLSSFSFLVPVLPLRSTTSQSRRGMPCKPVRSGPPGRPARRASGPRPQRRCAGGSSGGVGARTTPSIPRVP